MWQKYKKYIQTTLQTGLGQHLLCLALPHKNKKVRIMINRTSEISAITFFTCKTVTYTQKDADRNYENIV